MAVNQFLFKILMLLLIFISFVGIRASANLSVAEQAKKESTTDNNPKQQDQISPEAGSKVKAQDEMATVDVVVMGAPASELKAEDFVILDNNIPQKVSYLSRDQLPLAIVLMIDRSGSILQYLPVLQIAGVTALRRLKPDDQVALVGFDQRYEKLSDLTTDRLQVANLIAKIRVGDITNIYDPLYDVAEYLKINAPQRRHAIILISDNAPNFTSRHDAKHCRVALYETATTLYSIKIPNPREDSDIRLLAEESGGEVLEVNGSTSLKTALEEAIDRLRMQYTLGFKPSNPGRPGSLHKLVVNFANEESCPQCRLLMRGGYYAGKTTSFAPKEKAGLAGTKSKFQVDESLVQRNIQIAGTTTVDLDEIPFTVAGALEADSNNQPQAKIDLQIETEELDLSAVDNKRLARLAIAMFSADEKGKIVDTQWWKIEDRLSEKDYEKYSETGIPFSAKIPLKVINQFLKIVVYDVRSDKLGSRLLPLRNTVRQAPSR
jgi:VWFA-related protein